MTSIDPKPTRGLPPLLDVDAALDRLLGLISPLQSELVDLDEAVGRILACDLHADLDQPAFDRAMMDGFAVRSADCAQPGTILTATGAAPAGSPSSESVLPGTCVRVMTGGVVPSGADAVVPVEDCEAVSGSAHDLVGSTWRMLCATRPERHVSRRGSEVAKGDVIVRAGSRLHAGRIGALASFGHARVSLVRRPTVAILPTGSEIVPVAAAPASGQVRNSNSHTLAALVKRSAGVPVQLAPIADDLPRLRAAIESALASHDVLVMSGGVSMGDYDLVGRALADLGADVAFHRIRLRPGKPLLCATVGGKLVLGLPGNPVSSYVCACLFLRSAIAQLSGAATVRWTTTSVPLAVPMNEAGNRDHIHPGTLSATPGGIQVAPVNTAGSADLAHFADHDVLIRRPAGDPGRKIGDLVNILWWPEGL